MNVNLFKVLVDVNLFEKKMFLNSNKAAEFSSGYFQFFGVVAYSAKRADEIVRKTISDGTLGEVKVIPWDKAEFHSEFPSLVFDAESERVIYQSGRAFYPE